MAKAKKNKKSKGFLAAAGSIPAVGSVKKVAKKVKKKIGKVFTKARKLKNNPSPKQ